MPRPDEIGVPSNWGRWGDEDERGTANLLNAGLVKAAARLIENGTVYSLAAPLSPDGPNPVSYTNHLSHETTKDSVRRLML
jgi:hypothetical protein